MCIGRTGRGRFRCSSSARPTTNRRRADPSAAAVARPLSRAEVAAFFAGHGYAVAYQDCRGRYHSGGHFTKYLSEAEDGFDALVWLQRQPWCNGRVGTFGLSYAAHTQAALGCLDPPGLAAQFLDCGGFSNTYRSGIRHGGAFDLKQATWAYRNARADARDPAVKAALAARDICAWFRQMPWHRGDSSISAAPEYEDYLFEQWSHGIFDDYWKRPGLYAEGFYDRYADVPIVHLSGWYDPYARTAMENYVGLSRAKRSRMQLVLGPWTHGDRSLSHAGEVEFGPAAPVDGNLAEDFFELRRRWFDHWIKGLANGIDEEPPVRVFVMGGGSGRRNRDGRLEHGGHWRSAPEWPLPQTRWTRLYLHADRSLSAAPAAAGSAAVDYAFDPRDPAPTPCLRRVSPPFTPAVAGHPAERNERHGARTKLTLVGDQVRIPFGSPVGLPQFRLLRCAKNGYCRPAERNGARLVAVSVA